MLRLGIVGTPDDVIRNIEKLADLGINEINLGGPLGPDPITTIRLMGKHVIPHFRG
jgi:alkanesulfonate monooxygenase SsuD/methylene tetrahydromethanopterin reductase-like flavin-dependent oxidoreductase (luciferase family)